VQRRARDVDARLSSLAQQREPSHQPAPGACSRQPIAPTSVGLREACRAGIDNLTFSERQQLLRLIVDHVRVTGWQVEIQLRIPLDDNADGSGGDEVAGPRAAAAEGAAAVHGHAHALSTAPVRCLAKTVCDPFVGTRLSEVGREHRRHWESAE